MNKTLPIESVTIRGLLGFSAFLVACGISSVALAQSRTFRVVCYNLQADVNGIVSPTCGLIVPMNGPGGTFTTNCTGSVTNGGVLEGIGEEIVNGDPAQPIDVLALEETTSNTETVQPIVNGLNAFYSYYGNPAGYAMSPYQATESGGDPTDGNGPNAMVYNTNTLQLLASVPVDPPGGTGNLGSGSGEYREVMRYEFAPAGLTPAPNNEFYVYVSHYKASSGSANDAARLGEATIIRNDESTNLPANARVVYVGDYNIDDNSGEPGYQTICSNSAPDGIQQGQGVDPLNILWGPYTDASTTINWSASTTSTSILFMLSEESYELRYRDDLQIMTSNVYYDVAGGLEYVPGTYHSFGNNASLPYQNSVNTSGNTALNDLDPTLTNLTGLSAAVLLEDLTGASDHLPIVADYRIPSSSIQTVFIILEENQNWASISGNAAAPYINNSLLPMASHADQYYNPPGNHPSLPNYLWLEAGTNFGVTADGDPSQYSQTSTNHLVTLLKNAGISWTSYQEDMPTGVCPLTDVNQYAPKHNPMVFFDDVTNTNNPNSAYCIANVRPFTELAGDLQSNVVTRYNFITPDLCDDMHGNTGCLTGNALITAGDTWLSNNIPIIMNSQAYSNNGAIFITWDEGEGGDGPIGMIVLSPLAKGGGYSNSIYYTHSSTLLTMQEIFNVGPLLGDATNATDLSDLFVYGAQLAVSPASGFTSGGTVGGPFSPSNQVYTLNNTGGVAMVWFATNTFDWLTLSPTNGTVAPGGSTNITVSVNAYANSLSSGSYSDTVVFATPNGSGSTTEPVSLTISNAYGLLTVSPSSVFSSQGSPGGPFSPISQTYTLSNIGGASLNWTATNSSTWLTLSAISGSLAAGTSTNVTATINANADSLAAGNYSDAIGFTNITNGAGNTTRGVNLSVITGGFGFYDNFSTFSSGNLVGQATWTQLGTISSSPLQINGSKVAFTGGLTVNAQTAYKNFTKTNETVFYGLTLTVTNAPNSNSVPEFAAMYVNNGAPASPDYELTAESPNSAKTNYVLGVRVSSSVPYTFGATGLSYGTQYVVIVEALAGGTNAIAYVNPTSGNIGAQTQYAKNVAASGPATVGSFAIAQLDSGTVPSAGGLIGKVAVGDNFATVYTELLGALPPVASFTATSTSGAAPLNVAFTDASSNSPTSWAWTFGDGGTSTTEDPNYTYTVPGTYTVTLIASNAAGSSTNTQVNLVSVYDPFAWWQQFYGLTNNCALCGPNASYTGDGMSNTNKFMAGFNPTNAAAYLHVISLVEQSVAGTDNVVVTYLGANGDDTYVPGIGSRTNVLDYMTGDASGNYTNGGWQDTGQTNILSGGNGSGTITSMTDSNITASPARYYRVRVLLP